MNITQNILFLDNFNIPAPDSRLNYYRKYTVQGGKHPHSYLYVTDINGDRYGFLGVDACLSPGPKRPFNFVGMLNKSETQLIKHLIKETKENSKLIIIGLIHYGQVVIGLSLQMYSIQ